MSISWSLKRALLQEALKQMRLDAQLTQADLARRLNKPQSYVSKYESGERRLDVIELEEVCSAAGESLSNFTTALEEAFKTEENLQKEKTMELHEKSRDYE
ncbi:helix-turn-helix transcriptional regulator [Pseudomonas aeruginosa]|nr:helix-turn-helix transcriptional regulator [Pseudomonas aeruginosa]MBH8845660.1 helix-turn-helix transcriptional regulator [Pseudomonas aeruginosa]MCO2696858.1 helix-turn-helix transcriptional regulator [Pseudomonas aeruginosa]MDV6581866.1 helix-turn-helix transcriptional regulator [Pseudomonas aeruginosa]HCL3414665.1 helix-turn-helix transcriptional regulator [Pseudomonas aeruginosa]